MKAKKTTQCSLSSKTSWLSKQTLRPFQTLQHISSQIASWPVHAIIKWPNGVAMLNWNAAGNNFAIELNKLGEIKLNEFYEFQIHVTFTMFRISVLVRGCVQWTLFELIRRVLDSSFIWKKLNILLNWLVGIIFNISHLNIFLMNLCPVIRNQIFFVLTGNSEAHTEYQVFVDGSQLTVASNYLVFTWVEQWLYSFEDVLVAQSTFSGLTRVFVI